MPPDPLEEEHALSALLTLCVFQPSTTTKLMAWALLNCPGMQSMLRLEGSVGMSPKKIYETRLKLVPFQQFRFDFVANYLCF